MRKLVVIFDKTIDILAYVSAALIVYLMVTVGAEILSRKILGISLFWSVESSEHAIYVITLFSAAWLLKHKHHVKTDVVLTMMRPRSRALLEIVTSIVSAALFLFITYRAVLTSLDLYQRKIYTVTHLELIMWPFMVVMVIGAFFLAIQFIRDIHASLERLKREQEIRRTKI